MAHRAIEIRRRLHDFSSTANALLIVGGSELFAGNVIAALNCSAELQAMASWPAAKTDWVWTLGIDWLSGLIAITEANGASASPSLEEGCTRLQSLPETSFQILLLIDVCTAHLPLGQTEAALAASQRAIDLYRGRESRSMGAGPSPAQYGGGVTGRCPRAAITAKPRTRSRSGRRRVAVHWLPREARTPVPVVRYAGNGPGRSCGAAQSSSCPASDRTTI